MAPSLSDSFTARSLDLGAEQDKYIRLVQVARESLENSIRSNHLSKEEIASLTNIGIALERAVSAKIKYDKHQKAFAEQMTQEEEESAIEEHIIGMRAPLRAEFLRRVISRHNKLVSDQNKVELHG